MFTLYIENIQDASFRTINGFTSVEAANAEGEKQCQSDEIWLVIDKTNQPQPVKPTLFQNLKEGLIKALYSL